MKQLLNTFASLFTCFMLLTMLGGCAGLDKYIPGENLQLTVKDESVLGTAIEKRLLQMLGGPYRDEVLMADLNSLGDKYGCNISVADRHALAMYPLPGGRVIITRGLLEQLVSHNQLEGLLHYASGASRSALNNGSTLALSKAVKELFAETPSVYDPVAADIRIANVFKDEPCEDACLEGALRLSSQSPAKALPEGVRQLGALRPGYDLLAKAREIERAGELSKAIPWYLKAATETPDQAYILGALGRAYLRAGDLHSARLHLQKADQLQPYFYKTKMGLGYLSLKTGKVAKAITALEKSVRLLAVNENLFLLAEAMDMSGDFATAQSLYRIVADHDRYSKLGRTAKSRLE